MRELKDWLTWAAIMTVFGIVFSLGGVFIAHKIACWIDGPAAVASPSAEPVYLPYSFKCTDVKRLGDSNHWVQRCENDEVVCYTWTTPYCFRKDFAL